MSETPFDGWSMPARPLVLLTLLVLLASACGGSGDGYGSGPNEKAGGGSATSTTVTVRNNVFAPSATTVGIGATVSWAWAAGAVDHNVTFDDGPKSPTQSSGGFARTFSTAGTYPYRCTQHPAMTGTVTVK